MQSCFVPAFEESKQQNPLLAYTLFANSWITVSLSLFFITALGIGGCVAFMPFFGPEGQTILLLTSCMVPSLFFLSLFALQMAFLQCHERFFLTGAAPIAFNALWIAGAIAIGTKISDTHLQMILLAICVTLGCAAQWAITALPCLKLLPPFPTYRPFSSEVRALLAPFFWTNLGIAATQINSALDPLFALYAHSEGPAWLWYAIRLEQLPLALIGIACGQALLVQLTRTQESTLIYQVEKRLIEWMLPISCALAAASPTLIRLLFGYGHFDLHAIAQTSCCLVAYSLGLVPAACVLIFAPVFYAQKNYRLPARIALQTAVLSSLLNIVTIALLGWGAWSVALTTSLAAAFNAWQLRGALHAPSYPSALFALLAGITGSGGIFIAEYLWIGSIPVWQAISQQPLTLPASSKEHLLLSITEVLGFLIGVGGIYGARLLYTLMHTRRRNALRS